MGSVSTIYSTYYHPLNPSILEGPSQHLMSESPLQCDFQGAFSHTQPHYRTNCSKCIFEQIEPSRKQLTYSAKIWNEPPRLLILPLFIGSGDYLPLYERTSCPFAIVFHKKNIQLQHVTMYIIVGEHCIPKKKKKFSNCESKPFSDLPEDIKKIPLNSVQPFRTSVVTFLL